MMGFFQDTRCREFIEDADGRGSAARLNMVIGVVVGSVVVLYLAFTGNLKSEIFGTYMLATGGVYCWGKTRESMEKVAKTKADSPNQPPDPVPPAPATVINVAGQGKTGDANDVNIKAAGDVNVTPKPKRRK